jgi:hypothetical protein
MQAYFHNSSDFAVALVTPLIVMVHSGLFVDRKSPYQTVSKQGNRKVAA